MKDTIAQPLTARHLLSSETRPRMAKADLRLPEMDAWREQIGHAIQRAVSLLGWTLKEFAAAVKRDERQCARWINGSERPQFDVLFAVEALRQPLVLALAERAGQGVEIETTIHLRRIA